MSGDRARVVAERAPSSERPSFRHALGNPALGVMAVLPWALLDLLFRLENLSITQAVLGLLLSVGLGLLLGAIMEVARLRPVQCLLLLVPVPLWFWREIVWALDRGQSLVPWIMADIAVWVLALGIGIAIGWLTHVALTHGKRFAAWSRHGAITLGLFAVLIALSPLQSLQTQLATVVPWLAAMAAAALFVLWPASRWLALPCAVVTAVGLARIPERYEELRLIVLSLQVGLSFIALRPHLGPVRTARAHLAWALMTSALSLTVSAILAHHLSWTSQQAPTRPSFTDTLALAVQRACDLDGDGFSIMRGPTDCAPLSSNISPGMHELPDNGVDENCSRGSVVTEPGFTRAREAIHPPPPPHKGDVVFIVIDTLRYDSAARSDLSFFPTLARHGVWFEHAYSTSTFTAFALQALLAGKLPTSTPLKFASKLRAAPTAPVNDLVPWMKAAGYVTTYVGMAFDPNTYQGGAERVRSVAEHAHPKQIVDVAFDAYQKSAGSPRFLWLHIMWVHDALGPRERYEHAVTEVDTALATLYERIGPSALWVVTADHGEEFLEHGGKNHAATLYDEVVHVPLVIAGPELRPRRVRETSSIRSIFPTIAASVAPDRASGAGGPYLCLDTTQTCKPMPVPMALELPGAHIHGLIVGRHKILRDITHGRVFAFDRIADPGEQRPLVPSQSLRKALEDWEEHAFHPSRQPAWPYP